MANETNPRGWSKRRLRARKRSARGRTSEEKAVIRDARRKAAQEAAGIVADYNAKPVETAEPAGPASDAIGEMSRDEMIAEIRAAGKFVHPRSKDETLRDKVRGLRNG